ncbi:MAG: response regulator transcription factor, partial [Prevotella sp.]|nr:response regulator transcription factor [Prevotella sp.]
MTPLLLADPQDITRMGLVYLSSQMGGFEVHRTLDKAEMLIQLQAQPEAVVVLDYTLFDVNDVAELLILCQRFPLVHWILFSDDLSDDFVRQVIASSSQFSVLLKDSPSSEIREALRRAAIGHRYICQQIAENLLVHSSHPQGVASLPDPVKLTPTETEILRDIALGMTTREIADKRFSSFHTVNTHRKNIFRKIHVNNV